MKRRDREMRQGHKGRVIWMTGLPCSGKTTLANALEDALIARRYRTFVLDGDALREGLCENLGFSPEDRMENLSRAAHAARLLMEAGCVVLCAFVTPTNAMQRYVRDLFEAEDFAEVLVGAPLEVCAKRDVKGMYALARADKIPHFTGVSAPYEIPVCPDVVVRTDLDTEQDCVNKLLSKLAL